LQVILHDPEALSPVSTSSYASTYDIKQFNSDPMIHSHTLASLFAYFFYSLHSP
jgi:hypothetical protein